MPAQILNGKALSKKLVRVWENYEKIALEFPNIHVIDSSRPKEEASEEILKIVLAVL